MKKKLIYSDNKKFKALLDERKKFCDHLNQGIQYLKELPFLDGQELSQEDLKNPVDWWNKAILEATMPRKIRGMEPDPRQLAITYRVDYDNILAGIQRVPWNAASMVEYTDDHFEVTESVIEEVQRESSTYGTEEEIKVFTNLEKLLEMLNAFCDQFVSLKTDLNAIAASIHCKVVQQEDRSHKILPDYRRLLMLMRRGTTIE